MKKSLICMTAAAAMIFASVTSYAAGSYDTAQNYAEFGDAAAGKSTVLIYKGTPDDNATSANIVYVDQAKNAFKASTQFFLKNTTENGIEDGTYTVRFGSSDGAPTTSTFYIGMGNTESDVQLTMISGTAGYKEVDGKYNIGYTATVDLSKNYKFVIIKKTNGTYMGCNIPTEFTDKGSATIGLQINGVSGTLDGDTLKPEIAGVWLSNRGITK